MTVIRHNQGKRDGAIAPLTALCLIGLIGLTAFAIDLGWIVLVKSDLQSAADASALAGADALMEGYVQFTQATDPSAYQILGNGRKRKKSNSSLTSAQLTVQTQYKPMAIAAAKQYAALNGAGVSSLTLNDSDIELGYVDGTGTYSSTVPGGEYPNTVKVTLRRDSSANGALGLFFGPALNVSTVNLTATAAATIYSAEVSGFNNVSGFKLNLLPMTYDVNAWNNFVFTGKGPDGGNGITDSNSVPELQIYPSIKNVGNFGLLGLDGQNANASTNANWVTNGMAQSDVQNLLSISSTNQTPLIPLSLHNSSITPSQSTDGMGSWNWNGTSGLETSTITTLSGMVGQTYLLPLFQPLTSTNNNYVAGNGQGSNYFYNIVQFVSVKIISADNANNGGVVVQGSATVVDFSLVNTNTVTPAGASTYVSSSFTFLPAKLTQ